MIVWVWTLEVWQEYMVRNGQMTFSAVSATFILAGWTSWGPVLYNHHHEENEQLVLKKGVLYFLDSLFP